MSQIFFDTNLFVYLFEDHCPLGDRVAELLTRMNVRKDQLVTSTLTLGEVLVKPREQGNYALADRYDAVLRSPQVRLQSFDAAAARLYADIRADRSIRAPEAIQLACAAAARCDLFVTNDEGLTRKIIPGIQFIAPLHKVPI